MSGGAARQHHNTRTAGLGLGLLGDQHGPASPGQAALPRAAGTGAARSMDHLPLHCDRYVRQNQITQKYGLVGVFFLKVTQYSCIKCEPNTNSNVSACERVTLNQNWEGEPNVKSHLEQCKH